MIFVCFLIVDQDLDDLDLLACLVDSDSEFLDDDNFGEAISASNVSPQSTTTTTSVTQPQQPHEQHGEQSATTSNSMIEEMAGKYK